MRARTTSAYFERTRFPLRRRRRRLLPPSSFPPSLPSLALPLSSSAACPLAQPNAVGLSPSPSHLSPPLAPVPVAMAPRTTATLPPRTPRPRSTTAAAATDRQSSHSVGRSVGRSASRAVRRFIGSATETAASSSGVGVASRCALCPSCRCRCHRRRRCCCRRSCCCCSCGRKGLIFAGCRDGACRFHERRTLPNQGRIKKVWRGEGSSESHLPTVGLRLPW